MIIPTTADDPDVAFHADHERMACKNVDAIRRFTLWKALNERGEYAGFIGLWIRDSWGMPGHKYGFGVMAAAQPGYGRILMAGLRANMPDDVVLVIWAVRKDNPRVYSIARHMGYTEDTYNSFMFYERDFPRENNCHLLAKWR